MENKEATTSHNKPETPQNGVKLPKLPNLDENKERESTKRNKDLFLDYYLENRVIEAVAKKVGISSRQVRTWKKEDPEFLKRMEEVDRDRDELVEDVLMGLILLKHDGPSVRYYLDRLVPKFMPRSKMETEIKPTKSWKEKSDEYEKDLTEILRKQLEQDANNNRGQTSKADEPGASGKEPQNQGQEGKHNPVHKQPGATDILAKKDPQKPVAQAQAKGTK
jgi:hypothetical protein